MTSPGPSDQWPDERLDAAFRARFDADPPSGLTDRTLYQLREAAAPRERLPGLAPRRRAWSAVPLAGLAGIGLVIIAVSALWVGTPRPPVPGSNVPSASAGASSVSGTPWPAEARLPGSAQPQPVLSVSDAIAVRDGETSPREIAVGGWFVLNPVPCPLLPDGTSELEDCIVSYTWLMAAPERLEDIASDGSGSIHPPVGPGINPVIAYVDWSPPSRHARPTPVVLAGHFHDARASGCPSGDRRTRCEGRFVVDSIVWESGVANDPSTAPSAVDGLTVIGVTDARAIGAGGYSREVAVRGWYWAPGPLRCLAPATRPGVPFLEPGCEGAFTWLMEDPEGLASRSGDGTSIHPPTGPAIQPVFAGPTPPTLSLTQPGASSPVPVVFVGHFNDRRSPLCTGPEGQPDAPAACRARFVVDAIAWINGEQRAADTLDLRSGADPYPSPRLDPAANAPRFLPGLTILGVLILSGDQIGYLEPALARRPTDLSAEPSLWIVTVLEPPFPPGYKGVYIDGPRARALVFTPDGRVYEDVEPEGVEPGFRGLPAP
jgi:hypothetical protein